MKLENFKKILEANHIQAQKLLLRHEEDDMDTYFEKKYLNWDLIDSFTIIGLEYQKPDFKYASEVCEITIYNSAFSVYEIELLSAQYIHEYFKKWFKKIGAELVWDEEWQ